MAGYSLNELEATTKRAVRGAGYHWGHAEEAGKTVRWLAEQGLPGASILAKHLQRRQANIKQCPIGASSDLVIQGDLCPLITGAFLSDRASLIAKGGTAELKGIAYPLLLIPHGAAISRLTGQVVECKLDQMAVHLGASSFAVNGDSREMMADRAARLVVRTIGESAMPIARPRARQALDAETLSVLGAFAARTYAPSSEASRTGGAGAGADDQD